MSNPRYRKILLIVPPMVGGGSNMYAQFHFAAVPVAGIGYLSEFLIQHGVDNEVLDLGLSFTGNVSHSVALLRQRIKEIKPDLVGFQVMTYKRNITNQIIEQIKSPDYDIVIGGVFVSIFRKQAIEEFTAVDYAIKREGEYPLLELCQGKDLDKIDNLLYSQNGQVIENKDRAFITDLDSIPFPRYTKFELSKYSMKTLPIVSSRGCPYRCIYCANPPTNGWVFRPRSAENVLQELMYWYEKGYREFDFVEDAFSLQKKRVYQICDLIEQHGLHDLKLHCTNGVRADCIDRDLLKRMKKFGFHMINIGVEVGNNRMLKVVKKGETMEQIEEGIKAACELDYNVGICFTIGQPTETAEDVRDSLRFALKYPVTWANFYNIVPYPRTELFDWIKENNYFVGNWQERIMNEGVFAQPLFVTPELPYEERLALLEEARKVADEVRKRALKRSLKGSGPIAFLLTAVLYNGFLHPFFVRQYHNNKLVNKLVNKLIEKNIIKVRHF